MTSAVVDPWITARLDSLTRRETLAAALAVHRDAGPAVDPDPGYTPRHLRRTTDA